MIKLGNHNSIRTQVKTKIQIYGIQLFASMKDFQDDEKVL